LEITRIYATNQEFAIRRSAANNFGISFVVTRTRKADTVEHTSDIFLNDPDGKLIDVYALNAPLLEIALAVKQTASP